MQGPCIVLQHNIDKDIDLFKFIEQEFTRREKKRAFHVFLKFPRTQQCAKLISKGDWACFALTSITHAQVFALEERDPISARIARMHKKYQVQNAKDRSERSLSGKTYPIVIPGANGELVLVQLT